MRPQESFRAFLFFACKSVRTTGRSGSDMFKHKDLLYNVRKQLFRADKNKSKKIWKRILM